MLKTMLSAGVACLAMAVIGAGGPASAADPNVAVGIGPGGTHDPGPGHWQAHRGLSCGQGGRIVALAGFRLVNPMDCHGSEYTYRGVRPDGLYKITLKSSNGRIKDIDQIRSFDRYGWDGGYDGEDDYGDRGFGYGAGGFASGDYSAGFDDDEEF